MKYTFLIISCFLSYTINAYSGFAVPSSLRPWNAQWIGTGNLPGNGQDYGVFYFRKHIDLAEKPASFKIHVSADNRYKLYVNNSLVSDGPTRGDLYNWNYETVDIAPFLAQGNNSIAAVVWNEANFRPEWQYSLRTAFIVQGATEKEEILNTNNTWKSIEDKAFGPAWTPFVAVNGQFVDMNKTITGWSEPDFDDSSWRPAAHLFGGQPKGLSDGFGYMLVPSPLPPRERTYQPIEVVREASGITLPLNTPRKIFPLQIPANSTVTILLDQTFETNAYPTIQFSGGKNAGLSLSYAEALFNNDPLRGTGKSNRNEVKDKEFRGLKDTLASNGNDNQSFTPFHFRTFRYLRLIVQTKDTPLTIDSLYGTFTGYPFKQSAVFNAADAGIQQILDIGWRTARLNAFETYTDCPYYEQLQYIGDTRIQAMVSYYYSGDDRLARYALNLMDASRLPEGVTLSRYPTHSTQIIPTFSLWYIGMLHDYWMYRNDPSFLKTKLQGTRAILDFFNKYQMADGSLSNTPYWTFVDWANGKNWSMGAPPKGSDGSTATIDLQLLWAFEWAAELERNLGVTAYADLYDQKARQLRQTIKLKYWDSTKMLYADTNEKKSFSQHANALALLTGLVDQKSAGAFCKRLLTDNSLTQCTIYFKYYLHQALVKGGLGNDYMRWLDVWRDNIKMGLTTWAEEPDLYKTRSDCHAWGSSPNIEFFRTVLGIDSDAPGFSKIKIKPHLGSLLKVSGSIPHPNGKVGASYTFKQNKWMVSISLPQSTSGVFIWKGKDYMIKAGENSFTLN
ncbi:alpha-L-rhamnosidase-related protein [Niabella aquatica]